MQADAINNLAEAICRLADANLHIAESNNNLAIQLSDFVDLIISIVDEDEDDYIDESLH